MNSFFRVGVALSLVTVTSFALVADYKYTECSGSTIENHAGGGLTGQLSAVGATLTTGESTLSLTGNGLMSVEHDPKLDLVQSMTLSLWVKQSQRGQQALITRGDGQGSDRKFASNAEYFLSVNSAGKIRYKHNGISGTYSDNAIPLNSWTHIVVTRDHTDKKVKIYINGTLDSTYAYSTNPTSSNSEKLLIGECVGCSGTNKFKGRLDEIKIYNNTLSNNSVIELFEAEDEAVHRNSTCTVTPDPTATNDRAEVFTTGDVRFDVLDNDIDNNTGDSCTFQENSVVLSAMAGAELSDNEKILVVENQGMWSVRDTGIVTFTPDNGYINSPTPIGYRISDSCGNSSNEATITLVRRQTNPDGQNGNDGADGQDGIDGNDGVNGQNGIDGNDGANGQNGTDGNDGANGQNGQNGTDGNDGVNGQNGTDGNDGANGQNGTDGNNGQNGIDGIDGANGQNGIDGTDGVNGVDGKDAVCPSSCGKDGHTSKDCGCDCETYEASVPVLNNIGIGAMLFFSTLFGMLLFREESLLTKQLKIKE